MYMINANFFFFEILLFYFKISLKIKSDELFAELLIDLSELVVGLKPHCYRRPRCRSMGGECKWPHMKVNYSF